MLPELYGLDDYQTCLLGGHKFCKVDAHLQPTNDDNAIWKLMKDPDHQDNFDHSLLHRGYCLIQNEAIDGKAVEKYFKDLVDREISQMNLTATNIDVLKCTDSKSSLSSFDMICLISAILYVIFIFFATYKDNERRNKENVGHRFFGNFSLYQSWKRRLEPLKNEDSEKLKSIQGIRCYNLLLILLLHTKLSYFLYFVNNSYWIEQAMMDWKLLFTFYMFIVLTFILISSWLLTNQVLENHKKNGQFSLEHAGVMIVNRYFRTAIVNGVCVILGNTHLGKLMEGPLNMELIQLHEKSCETGWLSSLFYINNFEYLSRMCNGISWYLAADFQLYIFVIITLYVTLKFKLDPTKVLIFITISSSLIYAIIINFYKMDIIFRPTSRNFERVNLVNSISFMVSYTSSYSIMNCSCVGMIFGYIYFNTKHRSVKKNWAITFLWISLFSGLPLISVFISRNETRGISAVILGPLVKPLFVTGIGFGILGMSHGLGGVIKKMCEWKFAVIVGNFSYCIYMVQLPVVYSNAPFGYHLLNIGYLDIIIDYIISVPIIFAIGILMTLFVEEPGLTLQKKLLPQVKGSNIKKET